MKRTSMPRPSKPMVPISEKRRAEFEANGWPTGSTFAPRQSQLPKVSPERAAEHAAGRVGNPFSTLIQRRRDTGPSGKVRGIVHKRSGGWCEHPYCGRLAQHVHHRDERGMGGRGPKAPMWINEVVNLLHACAYHNDWSSNGSPIEAQEMGWLLKSGQNPFEVPVLTRHHPSKVWLHNDGSWTPVDGLVASA